MAILSTADQANLQSAIDLMVKSSAHESPLSDDVIQRIALLASNPAVEALASGTSGRVYEALRDNPVSSLIQGVRGCGNGILSSEDDTKLSAAARRMTLAQAHETPVHEDVVDALCPVAASSGFMTSGQFKAEMAIKPYSTLLSWALFLGSQ